MKYLLEGLRATVGGELFNLPHQSANNISRHDVVKDITRVEAMLADGYADHGCVLVLTNDRMCAGSPDHHGTTYDDFERLGRGRYRLRAPLLHIECPIAYFRRSSTAKDPGFDTSSATAQLVRAKGQHR